MANNKLTEAQSQSTGRKRKTHPVNYYDMRTSISVNRENWAKFQEYARSVNMNASQLINFMVMGIVASEKLAPLFDKMFDKAVELKAKEK